MAERKGLPKHYHAWMGWYVAGGLGVLLLLMLFGPRLASRAGMVMFSVGVYCGRREHMTAAALSTRAALVLFWLAPRDIRHEARRIRALGNLGSWLNGAGRVKPAIAIGHRAIDRARQLSAQDSQYDNLLANALNQLAERLFDSGGWREATEPARESIEVYERANLTWHQGYRVIKQIHRRCLSRQDQPSP